MTRRETRLCTLTSNAEAIVNVSEFLLEVGSWTMTLTLRNGRVTATVRTKHHTERLYQHTSEVQYVSSIVFFKLTSEHDQAFSRLELAGVCLIPQYA